LLNEGSKTLRLISGLIIFAAALAHSLRYIGDSDHWHHLRCGEHLFATGSILRTFQFTNLHPNGEYLNHEWLYQAIVYLLDHFTGEIGLMSLQVALVLGSFLIVYRTARLTGASPVILCLVLVLGILAASHRFLLRPQHFTYVFLTATFFALHRYGQGSPRTLLWLPLVMVFWVNLHAESLWGVLVPLVFLAAEAFTRPWGDEGRWRAYKLALLALVGIGVASLLNPWGYRSIVWPFVVMSEMGSGVQELEPSNQGRFWAFWVYFGLSVVSVAPIWRRIGLPWFALFAGFGWVAWTANRGIPHYVFVTAPFVALGVSELLSKVHLGGRARFAASLTTLMAAAYLAAGPLLSPLAFRKYDGVQYPEGAVHLINENAVSGNAFSDHVWGGFLAWHARPDVRPFIDGRYFKRTDLDAYRAVQAGASTWEPTLTRQRISIALLSYEFQGSGSLADRLNRHTDWALVYFDDSSVLFLRRGSGYDGIIERLEHRSYFPKTDLTSLFEGVSRGDLWAHLAAARRAVRQAPDAYTTRIYLANVRFAMGDFDDAAGHYELAQTRMTVRNAWVYYQLARSYVGEGRTSDAISQLSKCLELAPEFHAGREMLARLRQAPD